MIARCYTPPGCSGRLAQRLSGIRKAARSRHSRLFGPDALATDRDRWAKDAAFAAAGWSELAGMYEQVELDTTSDPVAAIAGDCALLARTMAEALQLLANAHRPVGTPEVVDLTDGWLSGRERLGYRPRATVTLEG